MTTVHRPSIPPGTAPGGMFTRICTSTDQLLDAHPLTDIDAASTAGGIDVDVALNWLDQHPGEQVSAYLYDGDTGECVATIKIGEGT